MFLVKVATPLWLTLIPHHFRTCLWHGWHMCCCAGVCTSHISHKLRGWSHTPNSTYAHTFSHIRRHNKTDASRRVGSWTTRCCYMRARAYCHSGKSIKVLVRHDKAPRLLIHEMIFFVGLDLHWYWMCFIFISECKWKRECARGADVRLYPEIELIRRLSWSA